MCCCGAYVASVTHPSPRAVSFLSDRWRNAWSWSSRFPTAHTRSWPPVCRASRAWTLTRSLSGHPRWDEALETLKYLYFQCYESIHFIICDNKVSPWQFERYEDEFFLQVLSFGPCLCYSLCVNRRFFSVLNDTLSKAVTADSSLVCVFLSAQKKLPLTTLAQCMVEGAAVLGDESLLGWVNTHTHTLTQRQ